MNEKDFKILVEIEKSRSITAVAEALYMTQPALTYRIQQIEQKLNAKLFNRGRTGIHPTVEGLIAIQEAHHILHQLEQLRLKLTQIHSKIHGTIRLGVASTFGQYIMPTLLKAFLEEFPKVKTEIITGLSRDLVKPLESGEINVAILRGIDHWDEHAEKIGDEPIYLVSKDPLDLENLPDLPRIQYRMDSYLKSLRVQWWRSHYNRPPSTVMTVDNLETAKEMTRLGLGYTILPGVCLLKEKELLKTPLVYPNGQPIIRTTKMYYKDEMLRYPSVEAFTDFMRRHSAQIPQA